MYKQHKMSGHRQGQTGVLVMTSSNKLLCLHVCNLCISPAIQLLPYPFLVCSSGMHNGALQAGQGSQHCLT